MQTIGQSRRKVLGNKLVTTLFFLSALLEIFAESARNITAVYAIKPLIIPLLIVLYLQTSRKPDKLYLVGLAFCWASNIFFISKDFDMIIAGACFFFVYRIINLILVVRNVHHPGVFPTFVGSVPFFFMYLYLIYVSYDILGKGLVIFCFQCLIVTLMGGISVGNHILRPSRGSVYLLISTLLFAVTQFIFVFKEYYRSFNFQPYAMAFFVIGQYLFYRFMLFVEDEANNTSNTVT